MHRDSWDAASGVGATATMVAAGRAMASKDPRGLINDPYAEPLVEAVGLDFFTKQVKGELDISAMDGAARDFVRLLVDATAVRTKYFDEYFLETSSTGIRQVVILASGLDTRAYRLPWPTGTTVYEIDQPRVLDFKTTTLASLGVTPTAGHRTVPIDLRDDWPAALRSAGLDSGAVTAWSAEGLLQYLPTAAQDSLLDNVTRLSAVGSAIAADYVADTSGTARVPTGDIDDAWRRTGFGLDMPALVPTGERTDAASHLDSLGWQIDSRPIDEVFGHYGVERVRTAGNHPLDNVVFIRGTLRTR